MNSKPLTPSTSVVAHNVDLTELLAFLGGETSDTWIQSALENLDTLLIDHANCEKKAASTALNLMYRYVDKPDLLHKLSQLAREEILHFEQVLDVMAQREIPYTHVSASRYAAGLRKHMATHDPDKLIDTLIVGAFIEARSCERFAKLAPYLDTELNKFYCSLLKSEARHFKDYLVLAEQYSESNIDQRVAYFKEIEANLIASEDSEFRFHSGVPALG